MSSVPAGTIPIVRPAFGIVSPHPGLAGKGMIFRWLARRARGATGCLCDVPPALGGLG
ncbi:MAG: hypothetical protein KDM63_06640 [Verrucomicrobiae bacterium]|nr:hypothetical protein [Verrucomicrobiae bacterium]